MTETPGDLRVSRTSHADRVVLALYGELATDTLPTAEDEVAAAEATGPAVLVLDLTRLEYIDSSGVRLVLVAQHAAEEANRRLAVRLGHGHTRRMFDMLGITERLEVLDDPAS
jgi:anti-anti-sigma factor